MKGVADWLPFFFAYFPIFFYNLLVHFGVRTGINYFSPPNMFRLCSLTDRNMKVCCTCKEGKSLDEFGNEKRSKDGKAHRCKMCKSKKSKIYRDANKDKISERKRVLWANRTEEQIDKEKLRKSTPEYRRKERDYKTTEGYRINRKISRNLEIERDRKRSTRESLINSLIEDIKVRDMDIENPYIFYHFKINNIYKFGITKYGVEYRYKDECEFSSLKCVHEYILGEQEARDIEKIVWNKTRDIGYEGDSPFRHTGITELRTEDLTGLVESLINELKIKIIRR